MYAELAGPFLIYVGNIGDDILKAKTGLGLCEWAPEKVFGQIVHPRSARLPCKVTSLSEAKEAGVETVVFGGTTSDGKISDHWIEVAKWFIAQGMNIACGMHDKLNDIACLVEEAQAHNVKLIDFRHQPVTWSKGNGLPRAGVRVLTISNDCSSGKKFTAYALAREAKTLMSSSFVATGQTGRLISDQPSIVMDSVPVDFLSGAMEAVTPAFPNHWYFIEGQAALMHPSYSGLTASMIVGAQPDFLIACIDPEREIQRGVSTSPASINEEIELALTFARRVNPNVQLGAVSIKGRAGQGISTTSICGFVVPVFDSSQPDQVREVLSILQKKYTEV